MKYLIINADDFGYCPRRNRAIVDLFQCQSISSTSLLVNGDHAQQACSTALPIGIHLNLTEGRPITKDCHRIQSLVDSNGLMLGKFGLRNELNKGTIVREHVEYEIRMQLERYHELMNDQTPRHLDGHQHIHVHPFIVESVARIARQYRIPYIRAPNEQLIEHLFHQEIVQQTKLAMETFDRHSLAYSDAFFGMNIMGERFTLANIDECLKNIKEDAQLIEFMCHPGYSSDPTIGGCGTGQPDEFSQSKDRQMEFDLLASSALKNLLNKYQIHLCSYEEFVNRDKLNDDEADVDANRYE